jgi:glycosyltransferase
MNKVDLTIILPTLNSKKFLDISLNSLKKQTYKKFQLYVCDGGSEDETLDMIKNSKMKYKIISKKDKSFEDGVNKCFKKIVTKYFCIMGSDDYFGNNKYLENLIKPLEKNNFDIVFPNFGVIERGQRRKIDQPNTFDQLDHKTVLPGIGWIAKKEVLKNIRFNINYKVASDYDLLLRIYYKKFRFLRIFNSIYYFRLEVGTSYKMARLGFEEQKNIAIKKKGPIIKIIHAYALANTRFFLRRFFLKFRIFDYLYHTLFIKYKVNNNLYLLFTFLISMSLIIFLSF